MSGVARGTLINLAARTVALGLGAVVTLISARMGAEQQGTFALFTAVEAVLLALCSGFGIGLARQISHHGRPTAPALRATLLACAALGVLLGAALALFARLEGGAYAPLWLLAGVLPLTLLTPNLTGLWLGQGRMAPIAWVTVAPPLLTLALLGLARAVGAPAEVPTLLAAWVAARVLVALGAVAAVGAPLRADRGAPDWTALHADARFIATIALANLISLLNYRIDLFLVERFLGLAPTGIYSIAVAVAEVLWFLSASLSQAAFARVGTPDRACSGALVVRVLHLSLAALAASALPLYAAAAWLLPWLLGPGFAGALPVLALLLPGVLVFGAASVLSAYFTNHAGQPRVPALMALMALLINIALSVALIPRWGMAGGALATSVSYIATIALMTALFRAHAGLAWRAVLRPDAGQLWRDVTNLRHAFARSGAPS